MVYLIICLLPTVSVLCPLSSLKEKALDVTPSHSHVGIISEGGRTNTPPRGSRKPAWAPKEKWTQQNDAKELNRFPEKKWNSWEKRYVTEEGSVPVAGNGLYCGVSSWERCWK